MSDIIITQKNLSRFKKRLQKSLSIQLKQELPLNIIAKILAQTCGVKDEHELIAALNKASSPEKELINQHNITIVEKAENFINEVNNFMKSNKNEDIKMLFSYQEKNKNQTAPEMGYLQVQTKPFQLLERYNLYFDEKVNSSNTIWEASKLKNNTKVYDFLEQLTEKYLVEDTEENRKLGKTIVEKLGLNEKPSSFYIFASDNYDYHRDISLSQIQFAVVSVDFFNYQPSIQPIHSQIGIEIPKGCIPCKSLKDAIEQIDSEHMVIDFVPLQQPHKGISSTIIYQRQEGIIICSISGQNQLKFSGLDDYVKFQGLQTKTEFKQTETANPYGVNERNHQLWLEGFTQYQNVFFPKLK